MSVQSLSLRRGKIENRIVFASAEEMPSEDFLSEAEKTQAAGFRLPGRDRVSCLAGLPPSARWARCWRSRTCAESACTPASTASRSCAIRAQIQSR